MAGGKIGTYRIEDTLPACSFHFCETRADCTITYWFSVPFQQSALLASSLPESKLVRGMYKRGRRYGHLQDRTYVVSCSVHPCETRADGTTTYWF